MSDGESKIEPTEETQFDWAGRWLSRARKDFIAYKNIVVFDNKTRKTSNCSDPALAVYLLQQTAEKTLKAVAIASGQFEYRELIHEFSHNTLALYADLYLKIIRSNKTRGFASMFRAIGMNLDDEEQKLKDLLEKAKNKTVINGEIPYFNQFANLPPDLIDKELDLIDSLRSNVIFKAIKSVWGTHNKITIDVDDFCIDTPEEFEKSFFEIVGAKLNLPKTEVSSMAIQELLRFVKEQGIKVTKEPGQKIVIDRDEKSYASITAMIALLHLVALTFPHESSSRYPKELPRIAEKVRNGLGCEDYVYSLGIVSRLGRLGRITNAMLNDIAPQLDTIASYFETFADKPA